MSVLFSGRNKPVWKSKCQKMEMKPVYLETEDIY